MRQTHLVFLIVSGLLLCSCRKASSHSKESNKHEDVEDVVNELIENDAQEKPEINESIRLEDSNILNPNADSKIVPEQDDMLMLARLSGNSYSLNLHRVGYIISYNNKTKNANWVAWHLTSEHTDGPYKRDGIPYMVDEDIKGSRQELEDWYGHDLQIDHGHMCPAGDNKWSKKAMEETFLLTNMCPQNSELNRGDWEKLESRCRGWAKHYGEIWITCGPIFYSDAYETIGENKVGVPDAFFKVVLRMGKKPAALGFIFPNEGTHHAMESYVMTVDEVEEKTGIDFFYNLPDSIENKVESTIDFKHW